MQNLRIFVDTEYAYNEMTPEYGRPLGHEELQIIQIAAILFDMKNGIELKSFNVFVKPPYLKKIPNFFFELTKISEKTIKEKGVLFPIAMEKFETFVDKYPIWTFDRDEFVFRKNCNYYGLPFNMKFTRVKPLLAKYGINANKYSSGTLHKAVNIKMPSQVHNALFDVRSMAKALHVLEN